MHVDKEIVFVDFKSFYKQLCRLKSRPMSEETATKVNIASMTYNYCKLKPEKGNLLDLSEIREVIKNFKTDKNLIISKPDKGNGCVILNKCDYLDKCFILVIQRNSNCKDLQVNLITHTK